jgi:hypothetical protein
LLLFALLEVQSLIHDSKVSKFVVSQSNANITSIGGEVLVIVKGNAPGVIGG